MSGYYNSEHIFGRSSLKRSGGSLYYLQWQTKDMHDIKYLTRKEYLLLKSKLGPVLWSKPKEHTLVTKHKTNRKIYTYFKKYVDGGRI